MRVEMLKRERKEKEKRQMNILSLGVDEKRKLLDLSNKTIENGKVKISDCKDLFTEAILVENMLDNCIQGTCLNCFIIHFLIYIFQWFFITNINII